METVRIERADGGVVCERAGVARTPWTRLRGLLGRSSLAPSEGMLFPRTGSVHTWFMRFPIDVVLCDRDLVVLKVARELGPWRMTAARGAKTVLELAAGAAGEIEPGTRLVVATINP